MKLYTVKNNTGEYLHLKHEHLVSWGTFYGAVLRFDKREARDAGMFAFAWDDDAEQKFEVVELNVTLVRPPV